MRGLSRIDSNALQKGKIVAERQDKSLSPEKGDETGLKGLVWVTFDRDVVESAARLSNPAN